MRCMCLLCYESAQYITVFQKKYPTNTEKAFKILNNHEYTQKSAHSPITVARHLSRCYVLVTTLVIDLALLWLC